MRELKASILEIELAIKTEDWDKALFIYDDLEENLKDMKGLTLKELEEALRLVNFLDSLLQEKYQNFQKKREYLRTRQKYIKFS